MDKQTYEVMKAKIVEMFGQPTESRYDEPNEARKRLNALHADYMLSIRQAKQKEAKAAEQKIVSENNGLQALKNLGKAVDNSIRIGSLEINDNDLLPFDEVEKEIIRLKFENWNQSSKDIALKLKDVSRQRVTALLDHPAFNILQTKVFDKLIPLETRLALLAAVRAGDTKIVTRLAEEYKILKPEHIEVDFNKPIDDPAAFTMLKELGDRLIDGESKIQDVMQNDGSTR